MFATTHGDRSVPVYTPIRSMPKLEPMWVSWECPTTRTVLLDGEVVYTRAETSSFGRLEKKLVLLGS